MAIDGTIGAWSWDGQNGTLATSINGTTGTFDWAGQNSSIARAINGVSGVLSWLSIGGKVQVGPVTRAQISPPPNVPVDTFDSRGMPVAVDNGWATFFSSAYYILFAVTQSGTTAQRPTKLLWAGRTYFDTTLGMPIWYKFAGWVNSSGNEV